jgi:hypothetical protein
MQRSSIRKRCSSGISAPACSGFDSNPATPTFGSAGDYYYLDAEETLAQERHPADENKEEGTAGAWNFNDFLKKNQSLTWA